MLAVALAAGFAPAAHAAAAPATPLGSCLVTPSANSMPFDVAALITTVRDVDGTIEVLHDVSCTEGLTGTVWIATDFFPRRDANPRAPRPRAAQEHSDPPMLTAATGSVPPAPMA